MYGQLQAQGLAAYLVQVAAAKHFVFLRGEWDVMLCCNRTNKPPLCRFGSVEEWCFFAAVVVC